MMIEACACSGAQDIRMGVGILRLYQEKRNKKEIAGVVA